MNKFLTTGNGNACCGCRACEQICPVNCIHFEEDKEGFLIPVADSNTCVDCNVCANVCPIETVQDGNMPIEIFAAANKDNEIKKNSSSGGIFYLLAKQIISEGGVVFGASLELDKRYLYHVKAVNISEINKLLGSKYIASDTNITYSEVKSQLRLGKKVLYVGTPCQIAGLKNYLKVDNPNLYTCDLLCHGVPSRFVFEEYIKSLEKKHGGKVVFWNFRDKEKYGWSITLRYDIERKGKTKAHYVSAGLSPYFYGFLRGKFLRESCYDCPYTKLQRTGDLTLADFWGVDHLNLGTDVSRGCSCILANTRKGVDLLKSIDGQLQFKKEVTYEQAYRQNINFLEPCKRPKERDSAILDIKDNSFDYVAAKYCKNPRAMRIRVKCFFKGLMK